MNESTILNLLTKYYKDGIVVKHIPDPENNNCSYYDVFHKTDDTVEFSIYKGEDENDYLIDFWTKGGLLNLSQFFKEELNITMLQYQKEIKNIISKTNIKFPEDNNVNSNDFIFHLYYDRNFYCYQLIDIKTEDEVNELNISIHFKIKDDKIVPYIYLVHSKNNSNNYIDFDFYNKDVFFNWLKTHIENIKYTI